MKSVLLDTVGLIALWEETDQWHVPAEKAMTALNLTDIQLVTTSLILLECGNAAARKPYRSDVDLLRRRMTANNSVIIPTEPEMEQAWGDYQAATVGDAGIVDHVSFIVMRRLGIADVFSNDRHFRAAGFHTLF
jgi:predicted nucleic acid-binding protein